MDTVTVSPSQEGAFSKSGQLTVREYAFEAILKNFHKSLKHKKDVLADRETEAIHKSPFSPAALRPMASVTENSAKVSNIKSG